MIRSIVVIGICLGLYSCSATSPKPSGTPVDSSGKVSSWVTNGSQTRLLQKEAAISLQKPSDVSVPLIELDASRTFQEMDGFGAALTGSSAWLIQQKMNASQRAALFTELFDPARGIGISYVRITAGASDFSLSDFTYQDDPLMPFSLEKDKADLLPALKSALAVQPSLKIMGSPWSAPAWMKTSGKLGGGKLKPESYGDFAGYLVSYIKGYQAEGVRLEALSVQNEPLHEAAYPSMRMEAGEQRDFIKNHLGPAFRKEGITTKILLYDHNWDRPDYPVTILNDAEAKQYVAGSAFHAYAGKVSAMSEVHDAHPDKGLYFTEISGGSWATNFGDNLKWNLSNIFIGTASNWSKNALLWNLALDPAAGPQNRGCTNCRGVVTILPDGTYQRNVEYYALAHFAKFVRPGAKRIFSGAGPASIEKVAFLNTDGSRVLIALNTGAETARFAVRERNQQFSYSLEPGAVATLIWE